MWAFADRGTYCPIVFNWFEKVKALDEVPVAKSY
jgi:hypothetical protein